MDDEQLRSRLSSSDPVLDGIAIEPADSASARTLLEDIMSTPLDTDTTDHRTTEPAGQNVLSLAPRRKRCRR